jgi:hypothetical protein
MMTYEKKYYKIFNPHQYYHLFNRALANRDKYLQQLEQLDIPLEGKRHLPINQLLNETKQYISRSYSLKYMGLKAGQIGMLSKRVALKEKDDRGVVLRPRFEPNSHYVVNNFVYPQPLKVGAKRVSSRLAEENLTVNNIEQKINKKLMREKSDKIENRKLESKFKRVKIKGGWNTLQGSKIEKKSKASKHYSPIYPDKINSHSYSRQLQHAGKKELEAVEVSKIIRETLSCPKLPRFTR